MSPTLLMMLAVTGQAGLVVDARTLAGDVAGELRAVSADGSIAVGEIKVMPGEWYSLRGSRTALPPWPRAPHADLTTGDRVTGTVIDADDTSLRLRPAGDGPDQVVRLPLSSLRAVWLTTRPADESEPAWLAAPRKRDLFLARNGDSGAGAITAIDPTHNAVRFQAEGKDHTLELSKLAAIGFNTDLARVRRLKGPYYRLTLSDGSRLGVVSVTFDGKRWTAMTPFKEAVRWPADRVVSIDVEQGRVSYLSDLRPAKYVYQTFDGEQFSWAADRSVTGRPIVLKTPAGESTFDRGLGLHADCAVTYSLAGKYRRFEGLVGMDATSGVRGAATVSIAIDGKEQSVPGGGKVSVAAGPLPVRVDVSGAKELTITVRRGSGGNVQDHVDLAEARLVP
jgi:hypothetical protein